MGITAVAVNDVVDMSNSTHGYVTVNYSSSARLKVGIQYNGGKTVFYDCPSGKDASFSLDKGNGKYTVTLYRNVSGTSYQQVESKSMNVTVKDSYAPYLVFTSEVQFSKGDTISAKAVELCKNAKTDEAKVIAIYNYMASRYTYDGSSYKGYNDYYLVVVFGYHVVNGDKINTPFYLSANNGIGTGNANVTDGPHLLQVNVDEVRIITATAGDNGKITPAGEVAVPKGKNQTFKITPNEGYHIKDVLVDRESVGAVKEYTFTEVDKPHTIHATFARNSSGGGGSHKPTVTIPDDVPTGLNGDDHYAYIVGYPDSTVRPQNGITRAEVATIFFRLLTDETRNANSTKTNSYSDVAAGAWYNHAVSTLSAMGIVKGDSHGKFNPNAPITRAEFAAIAARFDDKANTTAVDFSDIASHWAKDEISAAANNGWINGYTDGTFRPNNKITRAEAMTLVNRVLKRLPETAENLHNDMIKWSDNSDTSAWYYLAVQEATNSHYYDLKENKHEKWSKLRETRDWTELEK